MIVIDDSAEMTKEMWAYLDTVVKGKVMDETNPNYVTPEEARKMSCPIMGARAQDVSCVAKNCMAWRWATGWHYDEKRARNTHYSTTHGYCGMVTE